MNKIKDVIATKQKLYDWYSNSSNYLDNPDEQLKRIGKDISEFKKLLYDSHVKSCVQSRKSGVLKYKWSIDRGEVKENIDTTFDLSEFIEEIFDNYDMPKIWSEICDAPLYGYKILER